MKKISGGILVEIPEAGNFKERYAPFLVKLRFCPRIDSFLSTMNVIQNFFSSNTQLSKLNNNLEGKYASINELKVSTFKFFHKLLLEILSWNSIHS